MALEVPKVYLSDDRRRAPAEDRLYRLPENHRADLRDVARGVEESDAGVCCSYLVDHFSGEGADFDDCALLALERYAEAGLTLDLLVDLFRVVSSWRARLLRCRSALERLHRAGGSRHVAVLHVAYGHPDPLARQIPELSAHELGSLARYADAVEERRLELVKAEAARLRKNWSLRPVPEDAECGARWGAFFDLLAARDARRLADLSVTSSDALRAALAPFHEPMPAPRFLPHRDRGDHVEVRIENAAQMEARRAARKERERAHKERLARFLSEVRRESLRTLSAAERAYHEAWLSTPPPAAPTRVGAREAALFVRRERGPVLPPSRVRGSGWSVA